MMLRRLQDRGFEKKKRGNRNSNLPKTKENGGVTACERTIWATKGYPLVPSGLEARELSTRVSRHVFQV